MATESLSVDALRPVRWGILLALLGLLYGFGLGVTFGIAEDSIKSGLKDSAGAVLGQEYGGDQSAADRVVSKSWTYFKRAHLHAGAMGAAAIAMMLLMALGGAGRLAPPASLGLGVGALGYPLFWMLAGIRAPGMGSTGAAKASLAWLAWPSSGLFTLAALAVTLWWVRTLTRR